MLLNPNSGIGKILIDSIQPSHLISWPATSASMCHLFVSCYGHLIFSKSCFSFSSLSNSLYDPILDLLKQCAGNHRVSSGETYKRCIYTYWREEAGGFPGWSEHASSGHLWFSAPSGAASSLDRLWLLVWPAEANTNLYQGKRPERMMTGYMYFFVSVCYLIVP